MKILTTNDLNRCDALRGKSLYNPICEYLETRQDYFDFMKKRAESKFLEPRIMKHRILIESPAFSFSTYKFVVSSRNSYYIA